MFESRVRGIMRATKRGTSYKSGVLENRVKIFSDEILAYLNIELLNDMSDSEILYSFISWEEIANKTPDPEERLLRFRKSIKINIIPFTGILDDKSESNNIINLFKTR